MEFLLALPGACAEGLIWGLMAIGVYVSYKMLDIADLTVDGSICTGACTCAVLIAAGVPAWLALIVAALAGIVAGTVTGLLHTLCGIPSILAGILTQLILYSVNLVILGGGSMKAISPLNYNLMISINDNRRAVLVAGLIVVGIIILLWRFFYTEIGLTLKSTGDNPDMSRAQGVNVNLNKVIGLSLSNGIVALAGGLLAQYKGSANINDGRGAIVYYIIYNFVILLGLNTNYLKMLSALIVAIFLAVPYFKKAYFTRQKKLVFEDTAPTISLNEEEEDERRA